MSDTMQHLRKSFEALFACSAEEEGAAVCGPEAPALPLMQHIFLSVSIDDGIGYAGRRQELEDAIVGARFLGDHVLSQLETHHGDTASVRLNDPTVVRNLVRTLGQITAAGVLVSIDPVAGTGKEDVIRNMNAFREAMICGSHVNPETIELVRRDLYLLKA